MIYLVFRNLSTDTNKARQQHAPIRIKFKLEFVAKHKNTIKEINTDSTIYLK